MTVFENRGQWDASNTEYADGWVRRYEKGATGSGATGLDFIDYGLLAFTAAAIEGAIGQGSTGDLATVQSDLALAGRLAGYEATERFYEVGSPAGLRDLEAMLRGAARRRRVSQASSSERWCSDRTCGGDSSRCSDGSPPR